MASEGRCLQRLARPDGFQRKNDRLLFGTDDFRSHRIEKVQVFKGRTLTCAASEERPGSVSKLKHSRLRRSSLGIDLVHAPDQSNSRAVA